jgi:hypothetical protein
MASHVRFVGFVAVLLSVVGCTAKLKHVEVDPSFKRESLAQDGLAILGCTAVKGGDYSPEHSTELTSKLVDELRDAREGLKIVPWGSVREAVGDSLLETCFASMRDYGSLNRAELDSLTRLVRPRARYAIIHRVLSDETSSGETYHTETTPPSVDVSTTRDVSVEFAVYDLDLHKSVWNGKIDGRKSNSRNQVVAEEKAKEEEDSGGLLGFLGSLFGLDDDEEDVQPTSLPAPDAPTLESVIGPIYSEFADKLLKDE